MGDLKTKKAPVSRQRSVVKEPSMYKILLLNDHYTPMEFVVLILKQIFHKQQAEATQIMLNIHNHGSGLAGVYTKEIAETKVAQVFQIARHNEYPLRCIMESV